MNKFEIIVPVRNCPIKCFRMLSALDRETKDEPRAHVTIVDDASDDGETAKALDIFIKDKGERFTLVTRPCRGGAGGARNTGVANTRAEFVTFFDADDDVTVGSVKKICDKLESDNPDLLLWGFTRFIRGRSGEDVLPEFKDIRAFVTYPCGVWLKAIRRDKFLHFVEGMYCEDVDWWFRTADGVELQRVSVLKDVIYVYDRSAGGFSCHTDVFNNNPMTLEYLAFSNILVTKGLNDRMPSDALRSLAAMYDLRNSLTKDYVRSAWADRFRSTYMNILAGHWSW